MCIIVWIMVMPLRMCVGLIALALCGFAVRTPSHTTVVVFLSLLGLSGEVAIS